MNFPPSIPPVPDHCAAGHEVRILPKIRTFQEEFTQREGVWKLQNDATKESFLRRVGWDSGWLTQTEVEAVVQHRYPNWIPMVPNSPKSDPPRFQLGFQVVEIDSPQFRPEALSRTGSNDIQSAIAIAR